MKKIIASFEQVRIARQLLYWSLLIVPIAIVAGSLVALFLYLLELVTVTRWNNLWLIYLLPIAGIFILIMYARFGKNAAAGNNLIMEEIHLPGGGVPFRMTPMVLAGTLITHLFGGSAGREGTAVQMGGSIAALFAKCYKLAHAEQRILLMCGMAAGFGAVFGTPVAGAIFALEVLVIGRIKYDALVPCLFAALLADIVCSAWGVHHTVYTLTYVSTKQRLPYISFDLLLLLKVMIAGVAFGLAAFLFAQFAHRLKAVADSYQRFFWLVPFVGGTLVISISLLLGTFDYLGLGVSNPTNGISILSAFEVGGANSWSWFWKLLLTAITLSTGFKGGEVTPLFFIGATLGNTFAIVSGAPVDLFAALGFIAVFAGATNTPLACTLMGVELFGGNNVLYFAVACFTAYYFSGKTGIYTAQQVAVNKLHFTLTNKSATQQVNEGNTARADENGDAKHNA